MKREELKPGWHLLTVTAIDNKTGEEKKYSNVYDMLHLWSMPTKDQPKINVVRLKVTTGQYPIINLSVKGKTLVITSQEDETE